MYVWFILPSVVVVFLLTALPIVVNVGLSFTSFDIARPTEIRFSGLLNYMRLASDDRFLNSVKVTALLISLPVSLQMLFGLALAIALHERPWGIGWLRTVFLIPGIMTPVVVGLIWKVFLLPQLGGLNYFLKLVGIKGPDWLGSPLSALFAVIIAAIWTGTSFVALFYLSALETIPEEYYEAASIDGADWWQRLRFITLPLLTPITRIVVVFRILEALGIFPLIFVLTGGGPAGATEPINYYAYTTAFSYLRFDYAATLITVFFGILLFTSLPILRNMIQG